MLGRFVPIALTSGVVAASGALAAVHEVSIDVRVALVSVAALITGSLAARDALGLDIKKTFQSGQSGEP
jgi:hypothetical protein